MPETQPTFRDSLLRAVAIIGLIAILILGAWGIIQLVVGLPDFLGNFGSHSSTTSTTTPSSTQQERVSIGAPASVASGQPFNLSWSHTGSTGNYSYQLSYACQTGVNFAAPTPTGQYQQVACNTPFNYTNAANSMQLVAVLAPNQSQTNATITVNATRLSDNKVTSSGAAQIAIAPAQAPAPKPAPKPTSTYKPSGTYTASGRTSNLYGSADLSVRILSVTPNGGRYSVQFVIQNNGTNVAPYGWEFTAQLPTNPSYTFVSQPQQKLYPGDKIVYTLGFDAAAPLSYGYQTWGYQNQNTFSVTVDPQYLVGDATRANNTASATL
jgi:hypothetical protein